MERAGFADVVIDDSTPEFLETCRAWDNYSMLDKDRLREFFGDAMFNQLHRDRVRMIRAIEDGLLERVLVSATAD